MSERSEFIGCSAMSLELQKQLQSTNAELESAKEEQVTAIDQFILQLIVHLYGTLALPDVDHASRLGPYEITNAITPHSSKLLTITVA